MLVIEQLLVLIDFHFCHYYGSQWGLTTVWFCKILQNIFFCVQHEKETYTGLEWQNVDKTVIFEWTIPLKNVRYVYWNKDEDAH